MHSLFNLFVLADVNAATPGAVTAPAATTAGSAPGLNPSASTAMEKVANAATDVAQTSHASGNQNNWWLNIALIGGMILVFWLLLIRPQQKQRKKQEEFISSLKSGDKVVTAAGLIGRIVNVNGDIATLELAQDVRVKVVKSQIVSHFSETAEEKKPE
ncbi:MAG TPA: preprotein translocase subunit YajC [Myxococcota bacterium]|nr:preprotein translocase subunit YajC [Myxococcota bacterium]